MPVVAVPLPQGAPVVELRSLRDLRRIRDPGAEHAQAGLPPGAGQIVGGLPVQRDVRPVLADDQADGGDVPAHTRGERLDPGPYLRNAVRGHDVRDRRDDVAVRDPQPVQGEHAQVRRAVHEDVVVVVGDLLDLPVQQFHRAVAAGGGRPDRRQQPVLEVDEVQRGGQQVDPGDAAHRGDVPLQCLVDVEEAAGRAWVHRVPEERRECLAGVVELLPAHFADHEDGQVRLRVQINDQHSLAVFPGQDLRQRRGDRRLADASLEVDRRDDVRQRRSPAYPHRRGVAAVRSDQMNRHDSAHL